MESEQRQLLANVGPLIAIILLASGIFVNTVPLKSKRPSNAIRAKFFHAGRQDVEARLWADPFSAIRLDESDSPQDRCDIAYKDQAHYPFTLKQSIKWLSRDYVVTVLPVMVPGGRYFENGELRRRSRYAVLTALLNSGWIPRDEDKLGYVWTAVSCIKQPWQRRIPELLPYEWFVRTEAPNQEEKKLAGIDNTVKWRDQALLILWIDEDAITRRPLEGIETIIEFLDQGGITCPDPNKPSFDWIEVKEKLQEKLQSLCVKPPVSVPQSPIKDTRVIGPMTSGVLMRLAQEFVSRPAWDGPDRLRFYASGATAKLSKGDYSEEDYKDMVSRALVRCDDDYACEQRVALKKEELFTRLDNWLVRLTITDDELVNALHDELVKRRAKTAPFPHAARSPCAVRPQI